MVWIDSDIIDHHGSSNLNGPASDNQVCGKLAIGLPVGLPRQGTRRDLPVFLLCGDGPLINIFLPSDGAYITVVQVDLHGPTSF